MANLSNINNKFLVTTGGDVGIGVTGPSAKLHVHSTVEEVLRIDSGTTGAIHFFEGTTRRGILGYSNGTSIASGADAGDMVLRSEGTNKLHLSNAGTVALTVDVNENVGIGTTTPAEKLEVAGNIRIFSAGYPLIDMGITTSNYFRLIHDNPNDSFKIGKNGAGDFTLTGAGNVGIGTTSPARLLQLGNVNGARSQGIGLGDVGNNLRGIISCDTGTNDLILASTTSVRFFAGSTFGTIAQLPTNERMCILSGGNVGIGETNPNSRLIIKNTSANDGIRIHTSDTSEGFIIFRDDSATSPAAIVYDHNVDMLSFKVNGVSDRVNINSSGNVGIGTTSPEVKLDVQGSLLLNQWGYASGNLQEQGIFFRRGFTASNKYNSSILTYDHNGTGNTPEGISINGYDGVSICTGSNTRNERMRITSTGAISVGTSGTAYGAAGEVLTSNGNTAPSWQAAGGGGGWPQEKFAEYTIDSTTSNILVATLNSTTWDANYLAGCLKFTFSTSDYIQVTYLPVSTFLSAGNKLFFKGTEMTTKNNGTNPAQITITFAGNNGGYGSTCTVKLNRNQSVSTYTKVNVLIQAISNPNMFILN